MRWHTFIGIVLIVFGAPAMPKAQSIGFDLQQTFVVPGLDGIDEAEFDDIDNDGSLEVLVRRGNHFLLYSARNDSILFEYFLDTAAVAFRIELGDVNRDSVSDIVAASIYPISKFDGYTDSAYAIDFFDGESGFLPSRQYYSNWDKPYYFSFLSTGIASFDILDVNADGYGELLVSYCNMRTDSSYYFQIWNAEYPSYTRAYYSYPDSLLWARGLYLTDPQVVHIDDVQFLVGSYLYRHGHGDWNGDETYSQRFIALFDSSSLSVGLHGKQAHLSCSQYSETRVRHDFLDQACVGDIDTSTPELEVAARFSYGLRCVPLNHFTEWISGVDYRLYRMHSQDSLELLWEVDEVGLEKPVYLTRYPGCFFAFVGNRFVRFSGVDGSEMESTSDIPPGTKWWDYPYDADQPYLATIVENAVSLYKPGIMTDSHDGISPQLPSTLKLGRPYPNPFNAEQTIPVTITPGYELTVNVYNLLGQKVETLYTGRPSTNTLTLTWHADKFASGIYFVRATGSGDIAVVRSILLK